MLKPTTAKTAAEYMDLIEEPRRSEIKELDSLIKNTVPELKPFFMSGMLAYGPYHYRYESGREGDWATVALASQKNYISLYVCAIKNGKYIAEGFHTQLPKANIGKSCVRFKRLTDVNIDVIKEMLRLAAKNPMFKVS